MKPKRVDHAEASSRFIAAKDHIEFHDQRLWDLRKKRDRESEEIPEWQELRALASAIKEHTLWRSTWRSSSATPSAMA
jgi:L-lactate dehydrogenase complex protein LldF